jgi:Family of unknown function (DUF6922)
MIPPQFRPFFWDIDIEKLDPHANTSFVIGRILEHGTDEAVSWMKSTFSKMEIMGVIREDRCLSPKSATYWALIYEIPNEEVAALLR